MVSLAQAQATKRAAVYVRVSTSAQEDRSSLGTQEAACRRYAAERGWVLDDEHVYREVHTGTELWERPQLTALRAAVRHRSVDVVVAYAIDRLTRDPVHLGVVLSEAQHVGVEVEFVSEPLDDSSEGQLVRFARGYAAKVEHGKIKERTMRGKVARLRSGKLLPGRKPKYGYRWNPTRTAYEVDDATAEVVVRIKNAALAGVPLRRICADLMDEGVPTPGGAASGVWRAGTVRNIMLDPGYTGRVYGLRKHQWKERGKWRTGIRPLDQQIPIPQPETVVPPLYTVAEQDAIAARLAVNKLAAARNNRAPAVALLRGGYVRCGVCGTAMYVKPACKTTPPHYQCGNQSGLRTPCGRHSVAVPKVDAAVWAKIADLLARPEIIAAELDRMVQDDAGAADAAAVDKTLAGVQRQMRTLVDQLANVPVGGAVAALVLDKLTALESQTQTLETELVAVRARASTARDARTRLGDLTTWCRRFAEHLNGLGYEQRREAVYMLGVRVTVWPKNHPDKPADVDRYLIEASIPLDVPTEGDIVYRPSTTTKHNAINRIVLRWPDRACGAAAS